MCFLISGIGIPSETISEIIPSFILDNVFDNFDEDLLEGYSDLL